MNTPRPLLLMLAMISIVATHAAEAGDIRQTIVSYADLNLRTTDGAEHLYRRIHSAAEAVCRDLESKNLSGRQMWKDCVGEAISNAVVDVDASLLTAYYEARQGTGAERVALTDVE
jgi:UrcA family protein